MGAFCAHFCFPGKEYMMINEILLIVNLFVIYSGVLLWYILFDKKGLYVWTVIATIAANIEVLILVEAFGMEQTLGNILFASTFLVTDILSEIAGKKEANRAVNIGIMTSVSFIVISQMWLWYQPSENDIVFEGIKIVFSNTPRVMLAGLLVYAVVQKFDVWMYHVWWRFTEKRFGDSRRFLWLRNNGSTLLSQLLNTILFNLGAFAGVYDWQTLLHIIVVGYLIFIVTSLADTPFVYLARYIKEKKEQRG